MSDKNNPTDPTDSKQPVRPAGDSRAEKTEAVQPRRKRRWLRVLVSLFVLLIIFVALLPTIASTRPVWGFALPRVNDMLRGEIAVERLSLSWFGSCQVSDIRITDDDKREVLTVEEVQFEGGLFKAAAALSGFDRLRVQAPRLILYLDEAGAISLARALSPATDSEKQDSSSALAIPSGHIEINSASARVVQPDGRAYEVSNADVEIKLAAGGDVQADLSIKLQPGGRIAGNVDLRDWWRAGKVDLERAAGSWKLTSDEAVNLAAIGAFAAPEMGLAGALTLATEGSLAGGDLRGDFDTQLKGLSTKSSQANAKPIDLVLKGSAGTQAGRLDGNVKLESEAGHLTATASLPQDQLPPDIDVSGLMDAVLAGRSVTLPDVIVSADGELSLPRLAESIPALMNIRPGTRIESGRLTLTEVGLKGGTEPTVRTVAALADLSAQTETGLVRFAPVNLDVNAALKSGTGLVINRGDVQTGFGSLTASGDVSSLTAQVDANLSELRGQLVQLFDMGSFDLAGQVQGNFNVARKSAELLDVSGDLTGQGLTYRAGPNQMRIGDLRVNHAGTLALQDGKLARIESTKTTVNADERVRATLAGWFDAADSTLEGDLSECQADVAYLSQALSGFGVENLAGITGQIGAKASVSGALNDVLHSSGEMTASQLVVDGTSVGEEANVTWSDARLRADGSLIEVASAKLASAVAQVTANDVSVQPGEALVVNANVDGQADLDRCLPIIGRLAGMVEPPTLRGQLAFNTTVSTEASAVVAKGSGSIDRLSVGSGAAATTPEKLDVDFDGRFDAESKRIAMTSANVRSALVSASVRDATVGIGDQLSVAGEVEGNADLDRFMPFVGQLAKMQQPPAVRGKLTFNTTLSTEASTVVGTGTGAIEQLSVGTGATATAPEKLDLDFDGRFDTESQHITVTQAHVRSTLLTATVREASIRTGDALAVDGRLEANADLDRCMPVIGQLARLEAPPAIGGRLALNTDLSTSGAIVKAKGTSTIDGFTVGSGASATPPEKLDLTFDTQLDSDAERIDLQQFELRSNMLTTRLNGSVTEYGERCDLALNGDYDLSWDRVVALIHEFAPSTAKQIAINGRSSGTIEARGPACRGDVTPGYRGVSASTNAAWDSAKLYGMDLGAARFNPSMRDGIVTLPKTDVPSGKGWVRLGGTLDMNQDPPLLRVTRELVALEEVEITAALKDAMLGQINPVFSQAAEVDGGMTLMVREMELPLGGAIKTRGMGKGKLDLSTLSIRPGGLLATLLELGGRGDIRTHSVKVGSLDFVVRDGRVHYDNLTMIFTDDFDLVFRGSVGFDQRLDLIVSVPIRQQLLQRLGVKGPTGEYARLLEGKRVDIPIGGTTAQPILDLAKVNVAKLIEDVAVKGLLEGALRGLQQESKPKRKRR